MQALHRMGATGDDPGRVGTGPPAESPPDEPEAERGRNVHFSAVMVVVFVAAAVVMAFRDCLA